jgi:hypothetical protein
MTPQECLEVAQDQLAIACENLANQKIGQSPSYKLALEEVEACIHALKSAQNAALSEGFKTWKNNID